MTEGIENRITRLPYLRDIIGDIQIRRDSVLGQLTSPYATVNMPSDHAFSSTWTWEYPTEFQAILTIEKPCLVLCILNTVWKFSNVGGMLYRRVASQVYIPELPSTACTTADVLHNNNDDVYSYNTRCAADYVLLDAGTYTCKVRALVDNTSNITLTNYYAPYNAYSRLTILPFRLP